MRSDTEDKTSSDKQGEGTVSTSMLTFTDPMTAQ
jgi:hypothetical protein